MNGHAMRWAMVAALGAAVLATATGRAEERHAAPPGGDILPMARFYGGDPALARIGDFPGKLVCLRCDLAPGHGAAECEKEGHRHALVMEDGAMVHPLLGADEAILPQINSTALHGKRVTVHGLYYPSTGAILVDRIRAAQ